MKGKLTDKGLFILGIWDLAFMPVVAFGFGSETKYLIEKPVIYLYLF